MHVQGGYCPGGDRLWALPGWFSQGEQSGTIGRCNPSFGPDELTQKCRGGPDCPDCCSTGYTGAFCSACMPGYYRQRQRCILCEDNAWMMYVFLGAFVFLFNFGLFFLPNDVNDVVFATICLLQVCLFTYPCIMSTHVRMNFHRNVCLHVRTHVCTHVRSYGCKHVLKHGPYACLCRHAYGHVHEHVYGYVY